MRYFWSFIVVVFAAQLRAVQESCPQMTSRLLLEKKYKEAVRVGQGCSDSAGVAEVLGRAYFRLGYMEDAKKWLTKAIALNPRLELKIQYAEACAYNKEFKTAIEEYEELLRTNSKNVEVRKGLAQACGWNKEYDKAISLYRDLLKTAPQDYESWIQIGIFQSWNRKYADAEKTFNAILAAKPRKIWEVSARLKLAEVLSWQKKFSESQVQYEKALVLDPKSADAHLGIGQLMEWQAEHKKAAEQYEKALQVDPANRLARARLQQLMWVK